MPWTFRSSAIQFRQRRAAKIGRNKKAVGSSPVVLSVSRSNVARDTQSVDVGHAYILPLAPPPKNPQHKMRVVACILIFALGFAVAGAFDLGL